MTADLSQPKPLKALWRWMASSRGEVSTGGTIKEDIVIAIPTFQASKL